MMQILQKAVIRTNKSHNFFGENIFKTITSVPATPCFCNIGPYASSAAAGDDERVPPVVHSVREAQQRQVPHEVRHARGAGAAALHRHAGDSADPENRISGSAEVPVLRQQVLAYCDLQLSFYVQIAEFARYKVLIILQPGGM
jgi:hypothetical protein